MHDGTIPHDDSSLIHVRRRGIDRAPERPMPVNKPAREQPASCQFHIAGMVEPFMAHWVLRAEGWRVRYSFQGVQEIHQQSFIDMLVRLAGKTFSEASDIARASEQFVMNVS